eukprot:1993812-Lingulodinium_polyedra.AAC.1
MHGHTGLCQIHQRLASAKHLNTCPPPNTSTPGRCQITQHLALPRVNNLAPAKGEKPGPGQGKTRPCG